MAISHQLLRTHRFSQNDIAVVDPSMWHYYQPGWTLVGGGLKDKESLRSRTNTLVDSKCKFYSESVSQFEPQDNVVMLGNGDRLSYEHLVVVPGIKVNFDSIKGLPEALADSHSMVSSIYSYDTCDKVYPNIQKLKQGRAIFSQPTGVIKCAGAPQKAMWLALDAWRKLGRYDLTDPQKSPIQISFATGLPVMFGVPKYSATLEKLRQERGVEGLFSHDLVAVDGNKATFARPNEQEPVVREFDFLHAVPKMGPYGFVKESPLADAGGFVDVDAATTQHKRFPNVWSAGDASSLPTAKTMAAITSEAPVLVQNLLRVIDGKPVDAQYDGYTSCPLTTQYGKVLLAEFKYGGVPKETFARALDQAEPHYVFWLLKNSFFPFVYFNGMVRGIWGGPKGFI